jgi:hypothetical protein
MVQAQRSLGFHYVRTVHGKYMTAMGYHSDFWSLFGVGNPHWLVHCNDAERHEGHHNWKVR